MIRRPTEYYCLKAYWESWWFGRRRKRIWCRTLTHVTWLYIIFCQGTRLSQVFRIPFQKANASRRPMYIHISISHIFSSVRSRVQSRNKEHHYHILLNLRVSVNFRSLSKPSNTCWLTRNKPSSYLGRIEEESRNNDIFEINCGLLDHIDSNHDRWIRKCILLVILEPFGR